MITSALIANIDDDDEMEVMLGTRQSTFHFTEWNATTHELEPDETVEFLILSGEVDGTGAIGNFETSDDTYELLTMDLGGQLTLMDLPTDTQTQSIEWATFGADAARTGQYSPVSGSRPSSPIFTTALHPNKPNPFNPRTTISYAIGEEADVSLELFDVAGRRMKTLVSGSQAPGRYSVVWDGRDEDGRTVGSGVYFTRLTVGSTRLSSKLVLLR